MSFDLSTFEAEVSLKLISTEQLPSCAQDALEASYNGPRVLRMAILDPRYGWEIDQALPPMMAELGCQLIPPDEAALRLARQRAQKILNRGEDPLPHLNYFSKLMVAADYPRDLIELGNLEEDFEFLVDEPSERRELAIEALADLLSPELRNKRRDERLAEWTRRQEESKRDWPYIFNSPRGRSILKERYKESLAYIRPIFVIEAVAWLLVGWAYSSWRTAVIGYVICIPLFFAMPLLGEYRRLKRERRDTLLRMGVPDEQI